MHFHAEHSLFFERRHSIRRAGVSLGVTACVLLVNAGAGSRAFSLVGSIAGAALVLDAYARGHRRLEPALAWTVVLVALALFSGVALSGDMAEISRAAARVFCGVIWVLWLGTRVDWRAALTGRGKPYRSNPCTAILFDTIFLP